MKTLKDPHKRECNLQPPNKLYALNPKALIGLIDQVSGGVCRGFGIQSQDAGGFRAQGRPELSLRSYWVAVKKLKLSYHNGYIYSNSYGFPNIVT